MNYYNDNDAFCAAWLKTLITKKLIPKGDVDERPIEEVTANDVKGYAQCHFFAGIGGWAYALKLAGWNARRKVWTGSCPCQPFSAAGAQQGTKDKRHLWPELHRLIKECAPPIIFGEQVASRIAREWLGHVCADLEALGYAVGAADLCAASVGAPHIRQRLYWVAQSIGVERGSWRSGREAEEGGRACDQPPRRGGVSGTVEHASSEQARISRRAWQSRGTDSVMGNAESEGLQGPGREQGETTRRLSGRLAGLSGNAWADCTWLPCIDGKARPVESGTFPLAHGVPARMGRLRGYGNAIVPQVAAEFIKAVTP